MKNISRVFIFVMVVACASIFGQSSEVNIIPQPGSIQHHHGTFILSSRTTIVATDKAERRFAGILNDALQKRLGFKLSISSRTKKTNAIVFVPEVIDGDLSVNPESYSLNIDQNQIRISGREAGMFYALQSLLQLLSIGRPNEVTLPAVQFGDAPRFPYRGMHLDVARHFMPVEFVKKYIDLMSQYKFNTFHWHLTDDQGWRIEIKKYPRLTEIGSMRPETVKERNLTPYIGDGVPHGGFYTQAEIRDVVAYAKERYVTVIPEIELPGHASAALAAYPQFGCKSDYKYKVQTTWGIFKEVFCPTDETFKFLEDVIDETISLFPDSPYIHIGGDEVLKDHWKESPFVQELKKRENLKDEHEVQSYFVRRMERYINSKGKKIIGWDEILEGGLAPNAAVMSWRGMKGGIEAAKAKHDVVMTPTDYMYFDYGQGDPAYEPLNIGSYVPIERVYSFDPVPKELSAEEAKYVIGGQANIWTEYMKTPSQVEYMAFPRILALSEVLWSRPDDRDYRDFQRRLSAHLPRLDHLNINYRIPEPHGLRNVIAQTEKMSVTLTPAAGTRVYYTIDGTTPDERARAYTQPVEVKLAPGASATLKTVVVLPSGRRSIVYAATLMRDEMRPSLEPPEKRPGVFYELIHPSESGTGSTNGETRSIFLPQFAQQIDLKKSFSVSFDGYLNAPTDGIYEFQVDSTWDATVVVDGKMIIDDTGTKDRKVKSKVVPLKSGWHKISLRYNHRGGDAAFRVRYGIKGQGLRQIGGGELVH
ncbi:MAG: family 20 glycosylhydrolase [Pyrinomonadaceae bacterium]